MSIATDHKSDVIRYRLGVSVSQINLFGGFLGGFLSTLFVHPLDLLKVRFQVYEGAEAIDRPNYHGIVHALNNIRKDGGFTSLYRGLTPNVISATISWGGFFTIYSKLKAIMGESSTQTLSFTQYMFASSIAGCLTLSVTNPLWVTKTRLMLQYERSYNQLLSHDIASLHGCVNEPIKYRGMLHALYLIASKEGLRGLYRGFLPGLFGVSQGVVQFVIYEEMKKARALHYGVSSSMKLPNIDYLCFSSTSKILAVISTYPYQVLRSRLQDQHRQHRAMTHLMWTIWNKEGILGFYKGIFPSLFRVVPANVIVFLTYENVTAYLKLFSTDISTAATAAITK